MNVNDDLEIAQNIMEGSFYNFGNNFYGDSSCIYKVSNEMISADPYIKELSDKRKILSVIGSGDQIMNSILYGCNDIDGYDISRFPKYFLLLKLAGVLSLDRDNFIKFFLESDNYKDVFSEDVYDKIRENLTDDALAFWDGLFDYYDGHDIYNSTLFSSETYSKKSQLLMNPYLDKEKYDILKSKIKDANINFYEGNIFKLVESLDSNYDFINLSSIIYYIGDTYRNGGSREYLEFLSRLPLSDGGVALTYLYDVLGKSSGFVDRLLKDEAFGIYKFRFAEDLRTDAVLTYKKRR